tara:strand:+ start:328 stop:681 length:354 start_codon:yes stop_codon:yes gene_type:complete
MSNYEFDPNDFLIQISPGIDENCNWTGEVTINVVVSTNPSLCEDDHYKLLMFAKTVCAAVPMYEENAEVYKQAMEYVALAEHESNDMEESNIDPYYFKNKYKKEGNIINVDFNKKGK